ncbi:MAG: 5'/3'-nucleotidase SurE [Planctomycetes bacterium]|nr:5'/3'-nucleotidase SurE [Planctomycetota bacterium]
MLVLLTNDDGIYAPGIDALYQAVRRVADVAVIAPDAERSASGHAITLTLPLRVHEARRHNAFFGFAVDGTPADCVKIGVKSLLSRRPDFVLSGINRGQNTGTDVIYSGTVSAATEGTILGIPSVAISLATFEKADYGPAARFAARLLRLLRRRRLPRNVLLNVNVPPLTDRQIRGVAVTRQGTGRFEETFTKRVDPRAQVYYWLGGDRRDDLSTPDTDDAALEAKMISVTPIHYDLTSHEGLSVLRSWNLKHRR